MAKRKRGQMRENTEGLLGAESPVVPKPPPTKEEVQEQEERWRIPTSARLSVEERDVLKALAGHYDTTISEMLRLCYRLGLDTLRQRNYKPQFVSGKQSRRLDDATLPALPEL